MYAIRNISRKSVKMRNKRFKHRKLPICYKYANESLYKQNLKIIEEFMEQQNEFTNVDKKLQNKTLTYIDIEKLALELFDISQAAQQNIFLLEKHFGKHFCFTADSMLDKGINKNRNRKYYQKEESFDVADWGNEK